MTRKLLVFALVCAGCTGSIGGDDPAGPPVAEDGTRADGVCAGVAAPDTRLMRLTHVQYDNSVRTLLGVDSTPASTFTPDPSFDGFSNNADKLAVDDRLARDYQRSAGTIADATIASDALVKKLVVCDGCVRETVEKLLTRAFRRPATSEEVDAYANAWTQGKAAYGSGDDFKDGLHLVLEAALQSPSFLYRAELSDGLTAEGVIALSPYEIASRLSYMLWNDMPDDELFRAAREGELATAEGVAKQAARMVEDPKAHGPVLDFHRQWLQLDLVNEDKLRRDPTKFPDFDPKVASTLRTETEKFVDDVFQNGGGLNALLTANYTYVNAQTAPLYGLSGTFGADLVRVELDPKQRSGILTQLGFLASRSFFDTSSPIHRGVFIQRKVLCAALPDPPGGVDLKLPPITGEIKTTRQQVEHHTSPTLCQGCHAKMINPTGFAFEHYDATGKWRDQENGVAIDATGSIAIDDGTIHYDGAVDFTHQIANSTAANECYATHWVTYGYGRQVKALDGCSIRKMGEKLRSNGYSIKALLGDLTATSSFRFRAKDGAP
jgi:hypothetical protein